MTVTLAFSDHKNNTAWIAADSCASDSINHSIVKNAKVFHPVGRRDILLGCAGTFRLPNLLQYIPGVFPLESELATDDINMSYLINEFTPVMRALTEDFEDDDYWELLIAVGDRIYRMQMDLSIIEPADDCDAIGVGGQVALGAFKVLNELEPDMPIEDRINHALRIACDSCQGCAPPFLIMHTDQIPEEILANIKPRTESPAYEIIRESDNDNVDQEEDRPKKRKRKRK